MGKNGKKESENHLPSQCPKEPMAGVVEKDEGQHSLIYLGVKVKLKVTE